MSTFSIQTLKDDNTHSVIKLVGVFTSGTQESNTVRIQANTLGQALDSSRANLLSNVANTGPLPYYGLSVSRIWYDVSFSSGGVQLFWNATTTQPIVTMSRGMGSYNTENNIASIPNATISQPGSNGDIGIVTTGAASGDNYTIIVELRKDNAYYNRGQIQDPAAFNYGQYKIRP
jgi:hypothetical protein